MHKRRVASAAFAALRFVFAGTGSVTRLEAMEAEIFFHEHFHALVDMLIRQLDAICHYVATTTKGAISVT